MLPSSPERPPGRPEVKKEQPELNEKGGELIDAFLIALQQISAYRRSAALVWPRALRTVEFYPRKAKRCILAWRPYPFWEKGKPKATEVVKYKSVEKIKGKVVEERTQITVNRANPKFSQDNGIVYVKYVDGRLVESFEDSDLAYEHVSSHLARVAS